MITYHPCNFHAVMDGQISLVMEALNFTLYNSQSWKPYINLMLYLDNRT